MKTKILAKLAAVTSLACTLIVLFVPTLNVYAYSQLITFDNPNDLTNNFTPSLNSTFTDQATGGINNSGSVKVPLGSQEVWIGKSGYGVGGVGDVYTFSGYFHIVANSGYGSFGISSAASANSADGYGQPAPGGLGIAFHGGGALVQSDGATADTYSWIGTKGDLVLGNWYYVEFQINRTATSTYDTTLKIYNTDSTGILGSLFVQESSTGVTNTSLSTASTVYPFFGAAGSRIDTIDDVTLTGAAVLPGHPIVSNNSTVTNTTNSNSATINGTVSNNQGSNITAQGVCYGTSTNPSTTGNCINAGTPGVGNFTATLTNLLPNTTYYVQTFATNANGTSYSIETTFTTSESGTAVVTGNTNNVSSTSNSAPSIGTPDTGYGEPNKSNSTSLGFLSTGFILLVAGAGLTHSRKNSRS
jgi:hypothetical protein